MTIGEKIKNRRNELGWSQRDLAAKMGYSHHSTVARIESGKVDIPQSRIVKFSEVLGVSISYLMNWDEEEQKNKSVIMIDELKCLSDSQLKLVDFVKSVPDEKAEMILRVMKSIVEAD